MRTGIPAALLALLVLALPGPALGGSITATLDRDSLAVGQSARMDIEVVGEAEGLPEIDAPEGLQVEMTSRSMRTSLSRGQARVSVTFGYRVTAMRAGTWLLGPARVTVDGQTKASESFKLDVVQGSPRSRRSQDEPTAAGRVRGAAPPGERGGEFYAVAKASDPAPFVGESLTYEVEMGSFLRIAGQASWEQPPLAPLVAEPAVEPEQDDRQEIVDGRRYAVNVIRLPVFAVEAGPVRIDPATFDMAVVRQGNSFFGVQEPVSFESNPVSLTVRELPEDGRPAGFGGAVGRFHVEAGLDRQRVEAGGTAMLTVRVAGRGSLRGMSLPLVIPDGIRAYAETPETEGRLAADGIHTNVVYRQALVPQRPGRYVIPAVDLSFFDPEEERYVTVRSAPLGLEAFGEPVADDAEVARSASLTVAKTQVEVLGTDILPLHTGARMLRDDRLGPGSPLVLALLLLPPIGFSALAARAWRERRAGTSWGRRRMRRAAARAAASAVRRGARSDDAAAAERALRDWLTARLPGSGAALSPDEGPRALLGAGAPEELARELGSLLALLEAARFGGGAESGLADRIAAWVVRAERTWP